MNTLTVKRLRLAETELNAVIDWFISFAAEPWQRYAILCLLLVAAGFGLPVPEEVTLLLGGYTAGQGHLNLPLLIFVLIIAVSATDWIAYLFGRRYGHHVSRMPVMKLLLSPKRLARAEAAFAKHGGKTVFFARFIPGFRTTVFFTAGTFKVPMWKFIAFDISGACVNVPIMTILGYVLSDQFSAAALEENTVEVRNIVLMALTTIVLAVVLYFVLKRLGVVLRAIRIRRIGDRKKHNSATSQ